jgi:hypothetical protein
MLDTFITLLVQDFVSGQTSRVNKSQHYTSLSQEEFEDTKGAVIIRILKKNRQHNGQRKNYKRTNNNLQTCPFHAMFNQINMYFSHSVCKI